MKAVTDKITAFLSQRSNHYVSVSQGDNRLAKNTAPKYSFSLNDIQELYGSVADFVRAIPEKGFTENVKISLRSIYGSGAKASSIIHETLTLNFTKKTETATPMPTTEPQNNMLPMTPQQPTYQPNVPAVPALAAPALGYAHIPQTDWIGYEVSKQRLEDLKKEHTRLENELQDAKSEIRQLKEENFSLRLKIDTADEKHAVKLERELLNKKGFWESETGGNIVNALGSVLPMVAEKMIGSGSSTPPALGMPNLSPNKQAFMEVLMNPQITDEQVGIWYQQIFEEN